jgi:signal transduction histidine kinase
MSFWDLDEERSRNSGAHSCGSHAGANGDGTGRKRKRRRTRKRRERSSRRAVVDESLTPEERLGQEARERAERKVKLTGEALRFGVMVALLLIFIWPVGLIVLICGGPSLMRRFYGLVIEPKLRDRFIEEEVHKQVHATLSEERYSTEGEHARSMEDLSASIAHEIRNPVTAAKSLVQQMGEDVHADENVEYAEVALEELNRVERSVSHLLRFAREEDFEMAEMRMAQVVESALETFRDRLDRSGVALAREIDAEGVMVGDAEKLRRVVINLVGNAIDSLVESSVADPRIEVAMGENLAGSEVWLRVRDNGPGIDQEIRQKIFSPFFTSKPNGTGLGLAITKKLIDAHGGRIQLETRPDTGVEFLVTFPKQPVANEVTP